MAETKKSPGNWYEIGFAEGAEAGSSDMIVREHFGPLEDALAMGHAMLNGRYATVRRRQIDFQSFDDIQAWLGGVVAGIDSVGARVGFQTTIEYPYSKTDGGVVMYILVTRDVGQGAAH